MKNFVKGLMGVMLIVIAIGTIFYWEVYGRQNFLYKDIVVLNKDVDKNEVITSEMVEYKKVEQTTLIDNAIDDDLSIVGKAAKNYIPGGVQLVKEYFENSELVLDEDQYIFRIPLEWLKAFPNTLRRGDVIYFYEVDTGTIQHDTTEGQIILNNKEVSNNEPITSAVVAYVKDGSNNEVITLSEEDRYNGSNVINEIEIVTDVDTVNLLRESIDNKKIFIIMYQ
ncbi:hypothetical protein SH1V18_11940 [Vallitalea longa]|uniref:Flagella basal body P-ring formation protein FlgA SAF domain-containing protein n=1 Tax=Vallitalea longa TaxID=2936439 RepID=A0A9W6DFH5_9FIRM|nr:SAF domain-containing protein [Vallitalea longa]GKX28714.1 hypothetical protein SH1V18_11940 [Vallitalea longa]